MSKPVKKLELTNNPYDKHFDSWDILTISEIIAKDMTCTECEGRGTKCYLEPRYKYKSGNEVRRDYQNVKELELINISWGSPTISME